jgi:hypothetical protein
MALAHVPSQRRTLTQKEWGVLEGILSELTPGYAAVITVSAWAPPGIHRVGPMVIMNEDSWQRAKYTADLHGESLKRAPTRWQAHA